MQQTVLRLALTLLVLGTWTAGAQTPYGWRRDGSGLFPEASPPTKWNLATGENVLWKTPMRSWSHASPILAGDRIFVQSEETWLACLDKRTGKVLWERANDFDILGERGKGRTKPTNSFVKTCYGYTASTPVTDGQCVYAVFGHGVVVAYDMEGRLKWANTFDVENKQRSGIAQSQTLVGDVLLIGAAEKDAFAAFDKRTGKHLWSVPRGGMMRGKGSFQTVAIANVPYLLASDGWLIDASGKVVQRDLLGKNGKNYGPTPVVGQGVAFGSELSGKRMVATPIRPGQEPAPLWEKVVGAHDARSPLYHDGLVYAVGERGALRVLDAATGADVYTKAGLPGGWTSMALAGPYIVWLGSEGGDAVLFKPGRRYDEVARFKHGFKNKGGPDNKLGCSPIFEGKRMYHRDAVALYCIGTR
jgi:outer membrane protein assembly factor BamB